MLDHVFGKNPVERIIRQREATSSVEVNDFSPAAVVDDIGIEPTLIHVRSRAKLELPNGVRFDVLVDLLSATHASRNEPAAVERLVHGDASAADRSRQWL